METGKSPIGCQSRASSGCQSGVLSGCQSGVSSGCQSGVSSEALSGAWGTGGGSRQACLGYFDYRPRIIYLGGRRRVVRESG